MGRKINTVKNFLSKIFTLSYSRWRFFTFLTILILLLVLPFPIIEKTQNFSICRLILGDYCYSVGLTRGVSSLLKGDFNIGLEYNPLSIIVLGVLIGFIISDFYKGFIKYE